MKWSRMLLLLVLAFTSTACVLLKTDERIDVVVAATDLGAGRKITDKDITVIGMPVSRKLKSSCVNSTFCPVFEIFAESALPFNPPMATTTSGL